jgi:hypothetical protein
VPKRIWIEIVGLNSGTGKRSCTLHLICGQSVATGNYLCLKRTIITFKKIDEEANKMVKIDEGIGESCTVGFIPRVMATLPWSQAKIGHVVKVVELYADSSNTHKKRKDQQNMRMGCAEFVDRYLDDIPHEE